MSAAAAETTLTNTVQEAARAPLAVPEALAAEPARGEVRPPEHHDVSAAVVPPEGKLPQLPQPPVQVAAEVSAPAAKDELGGVALAIEQQLATYIGAGERIPAALKEGLVLDIGLADSTAITGTPGATKDMAISIKGASLANPDTAAQLATVVRTVLQAHPALAGKNLIQPENSDPSALRFQVLSLDDAQLQALRAAPVEKQGTPIVAPTPIAPNADMVSPLAAAEHVSAGAHCAQCAASKEAPAPASIAADAPVAALPAAPAVDQPLGEIKPAALGMVPAAPATIIAAPAANEATLAPEKPMAQGAAR